MPFDKFAGLDSEEAVIEFFESEFPDAIPMIGEKELGKQVASSKALPMVSIKCSPYNYMDKAVIVGEYKSQVKRSQSNAHHTITWTRQSLWDVVEYKSRV